MNKDNAHLYLPLVQALADGKIIQIKLGSKWRDNTNPVDTVGFTYPPEFYRIKPEPRTFLLYIIEPDGTNGETLITTHPTYDNRWKQITVQEVLQ